MDDKGHQETTARVEIERPDGKSRSQLIASLTINSAHRNALPMMGFGTAGFGGTEDLDAKDMMAEMATATKKVREGKLDDLTDVLTTQTLVMDSMFTEYSRRAMMNIGKHPHAVDRYMALALKAQNQCRTSVETLARVRRGGKQTVKVVHVHKGGQAVVADNFNTGDQKGGNSRNGKQAHEQGTCGSKVLSQDEAGYGVPLPSNEGKEAVQIARRKGDGRAEGE